MLFLKIWQHTLQFNALAGIIIFVLWAFWTIAMEDGIREIPNNTGRWQYDEPHLLSFSNMPWWATLQGRERFPRTTFSRRTISRSTFSRMTFSSSLAVELWSYAAHGLGGRREREEREMDWRCALLDVDRGWSPLRWTVALIRSSDQRLPWPWPTLFNVWLLFNICFQYIFEKYDFNNFLIPILFQWKTPQTFWKLISKTLFY